jgi:WD40 repeat protein
VIMGVTHRRRIVLVSLLVGLVVTLDPRPEIAGAPRAARGVVPLGTIEVAGTVWHLRLDDAGRRLALSTVRYPENELQRNELSLYTLPASGTLAERPVVALTRDIDDAEAMALSPDGDWLAVACGSDVCLHGWGAAGTERRLVGVGRRRELGALALRPDAKLLVAAQRNRMEVLVWDLPDGPRRQWVVASGGERVREWVTPRLHGQPPWTPRWVGVSRDGQRIGSIRDDGTISLWGRDGRSIVSRLLSRYADLEPAFASDDRLVALRVGDRRLNVIDVESERVLLSVTDPPSKSMRRAALLFGRDQGYLAVSSAGGVALHAIPSGEAAAIIPEAEPVWRLAMNGQGRVIAVGTQHRVTIWSLTGER